MAVSKSRHHIHDTTEFAAVEASCAELADVLSRSHGFKKSFHRLESDTLTAKEHETGLVLAYCLRGSNWTIIDPIMSRDINLGAIGRATKKLNTQSVSAAFCRNSGAFGYFHTRNGRNIEEFCSTNPEFHELSVEEARRKGWQLCSNGFRRLKTGRKIEPDLNTVDGFDLLSELTDELGVNVPPPPNWSVENGMVAVEPYVEAEKREPVAAAALLCLA